MSGEVPQKLIYAIASVLTAIRATAERLHRPITTIKIEDTGPEYPEEKWSAINPEFTVSESEHGYWSTRKQVRHGVAKEN